MGVFLEHLLLKVGDSVDSRLGGWDLTLIMSVNFGKY
jgi:hypothetical protein